MGADDFGGGLWVLVIINSVIFIATAAGFFHPHGGAGPARYGFHAGDGRSPPPVADAAHAGHFPGLALAYWRLALLKKGR
jgi:hypothetical protein